MSISVEKFVKLRDSLVAEKADLEAQMAGLQGRLAEINAALGEDVSAPAASPARRGAGRPAGGKKKAAAKKVAKKKGEKKKAAKKKAGRRGGRRSRSAVPLKETMVTVMGKKALTRQEIAAGVEAAGYTSANVLNSVSATLYQNKSFVKDGKKWKLA